MKVLENQTIFESPAVEYVTSSSCAQLAWYAGLRMKKLRQWALL
jgi:hypothetical protein